MKYSKKLIGMAFVIGVITFWLSIAIVSGIGIAAEYINLEPIRLYGAILAVVIWFILLDQAGEKLNLSSENQRRAEE